MALEGAVPRRPEAAAGAPPWMMAGVSVLAPTEADARPRSGASAAAVAGSLGT